MSEKKRASDVFLALVQENVQNYSLEVFRELMTTWQEILDLEAIADAMLGPEEATYPDKIVEVKSFWPEKATGGASPSPTVTADEPEKKPAPDPEDEEVRKAKLKQKSERGKTAFSLRKQADLGAVTKARAEGVSLQTLADKSGLTLNAVLDLINGEAKPISDWANLEKGLKKLGYPPGGEKKEERAEDGQTAD